MFYFLTFPLGGLGQMTLFQVGSASCRRKGCGADPPHVWPSPNFFLGLESVFPEACVDLWLDGMPREDSHGLSRRSH